MSKRGGFPGGMGGFGGMNINSLMKEAKKMQADLEMLQDLIVTCINQAFKQVDDAQAASMGKFNIPGIM